MGKVLLLAIVAGVIAYGAWKYRSDRPPERPVYAEIRVKHTQSGVELVGIGKMNSDEDCRLRTEVFWGKIFKADERFELSMNSCSPELSERHANLFADRPIHATYVALDRGNAGERDGRFIIFGVPSSEAVKVCPDLINRIKQTYSGTVRCVAGTIG